MKILLIRNDCIGDMVISSGVFREIKKSYPKSEVTVLCSSINKALIEKNKNVDHIIVCDAFWRKKTPSSMIQYLKVLHQIRKEQFDIGIDLRSSCMTIFSFLYLGKVKKRVAYYEHPFNKSSRFLTDAPSYENNIETHACINDLSLIDFALNMGRSNFFPDIQTDETDRNNITSFLRQNSMKENKFVCICPDASSEKKQWSLNNYSAVIAHISRKYPNHKIVLVGADQDKMLALTLFCQTADIVWFTNHNLREVYLLMQKSSLVLAQDGGPMHLAWAGNSKLVALIPDYLSPAHCGPLGKNSHIIYKDMKKINIKEVTDKIREVLK